jgi:hypothetical protein
MKPAGGIPTTYRHYRFRSRIEAKWAAMFDQIGWRWEYEPFDAAGYIPDFIITGDSPMLIEVKSDTSLGELTQHARRVTTATAGHWKHDILILGSILDHPATDWIDARSPGVLIEAENEPNNSGEALWTQCGKCQDWAVIHSWQSYECRPCGHHDGDHYIGNRAVPREQWARAHNAVQWMNPRHPSTA